MRIIQPARKARTKNQDGSTPLSSDSNSESGDFLFSDDTTERNADVIQKSRRKPLKKLLSKSTSKPTNGNSEKVKSSSSDNISPAKKEFNALMARGMRVLAMREHSIYELTNKLSEKALSQDVLNEVLDELIANNYVSDERFAESYIRSRANRGFGPIKIRAELNKKGISNQLISDHLDVSSAIWLDNARDQYQKKYTDRAIADYKVWTKRARFMQSRGFTAEQIQGSLPAVEYFE